MTARSQIEPSRGQRLSGSGREIDGAQREASRSPAPTSRGWRGLEAAITLAILMVVVLTVADSIAAAAWVEDSPDLLLVAGLGLVVAGLLAASPLRWPVAILLGLLAGAVVVLWQVLTVDLVADQPLFFERFRDLGVRLDDWFRQAFRSDLATDNLPFIFFVSVALWVATFPTSFLVWRRRNPWPLLIVLGVMLAFNVRYLSGRQWDLHFAFFVAGAGLLIMRTTLLGRMARWRATGTPYPTYLSLSFLAVTVVAVAALVGVTRALPRPDRPEAFSNFWSGVTAPFPDFVDQLQDLFSGIDLSRGGSIHDFGDSFVMQGGISAKRGIRVRVDSPESGLLRGATYDRYTTRGWDRSGTVTASVGGERAITALSGDDEEGYRERRDVTVRLSMETESEVLFTFGMPATIDHEVSVVQPEPARVRLGVNAAGGGAPSAELALASQEIALRQTVEPLTDEQVLALLPEGYDVVGVERDLEGEALRALELESRPEQMDVVALRPLDTVERGFTYRVTGTVSDALPAALRAAGTDYPFWVRDRFLQLPASLLDSDRARLLALARLVTTDTDSHYDAAVAISGFLCCSVLAGEDGQPVLTADGLPRLRYPFSRHVQSPPRHVDTVAWWLFDHRDADGYPAGGYYDYYSSSMAVLLRSLGIPARVTAGYVLNENNYDARTDTYIVQVAHTYSWVEVFFPSYGWVEFDPTPRNTGEEFADIGGDRLSNQGLAPFRSESLDAGGLLGVEGLAAFFAAGILVDDSPASQVDEGTDGGGQRWLILGPLIGLGLIVTAGGGTALAWRVSLRGLSPIERTWKSTQRLSRFAGLPADPAATPSEYAARVGAAVGASASARRLADSYARQRFGGKRLTDREIGEARRSGGILRSRLLRHLLRLPQPLPESVAKKSAPRAQDDGRACGEQPPTDGPSER